MQKHLTSSSIITILAGQEKQQVQVHDSVLRSSSSPTLASLLSDKWKEGQEGIIDWSHTEAKTILTVIEWCYTGHYHVDGIPQNIPEPIDDPQCIDEPEFEHTHWYPGEVDVERFERLAAEQAKIAFDREEEDQHGHLTRKSVFTASAQRVLEDFDDRNATFTSQTSHEGTDQAQCLPVSAADRLSIISDICLMHIKVYIFAHEYMMTSLQRYAAGRLLHFLETVFDEAMYSKMASDILIPAITLACNELPATEAATNRKDPVLQIFALFVAHHFTSFDQVSLREVVRTFGDFAMDIMARMSRLIP